MNRKITRLPAHNYRGRQSYFVTICTNHRVPHLAASTVSQNVRDLLNQCATKCSSDLHAFCLMPDHIHILVGGTRDTCDLLEFIRVFKQRPAYEFRQTSGQPLWETGFYDHVLRPHDKIDDVASYIWWNPVRKNLCKYPSDYQFSGSQTIDWIRKSSAVPLWFAPWKRKEPT